MTNENHAGKENERMFDIIFLHLMILMTYDVLGSNVSKSKC